MQHPFGIYGNDPMVHRYPFGASFTCPSALKREHVVFLRGKTKGKGVGSVKLTATRTFVSVNDPARDDGSVIVDSIVEIRIKILVFVLDGDYQSFTAVKGGHTVYFRLFIEYLVGIIYQIAESVTVSTLDNNGGLTVVACAEERYLGIKSLISGYALDVGRNGSK